MLQFIVLGIVPGTNIQINFGDVLRLVLGIIMMFVLYRKISRYYIHVKTSGKFLPYLHKQV